MEPATTSLAVNVVTTLIPFLTKGAEEIAKSIGKDAYAKGKNLLDTLKKRWSGDKAAEGALAGFEEDPDTFRTALEGVLLKRLADDNELAGELENIMNELGPALTVIQKMMEADGVTGVEAGMIKSGKVNVAQEAEIAKNMTGMKVDRIG